MSQADITAKPVNESFSELLDQSFQEMTSIEGSVVAGTVLSIEKDMILIDVGLKSEGRVPLREFGNNEEMNKYQNKIKGAELKCETIPTFNINFDQADLFMDMRSPECKAQFDIDDWI